MSTKALAKILIGCCFLILVAPVLAGEKAAPEPLVQRVQRAIKAGIDLLRQKESGNGSWEACESGSRVYPGGYTSLAMLALLNAGVRPDDPIIERSLKYLRDVEPEFTYVVALQTMVFAELARSEDRQRIERNVKWLIDSRLMDGRICRGWTYKKNNLNIADNSNTQYALLGLHAGHEAGIEIDPAVWESIRDMYIRSQLLEGSWVYQNQLPRPPGLLTMTTAGLCGLLISGLELNKGREVLRPDGTATNCGVYEENENLARAIRWIGHSNNFRPFRSGNTWVDLHGHNYYNLYGLERAGRLSGQRFFGDFDWYREGCEYLVEHQQENGGWSEREAIGNSEIVPTCFALLFLAKGRTPVLISKLAHGPGEDWNNDRNDARNLVSYASKNVFRHLPLGWQVFDARGIEASTNDAILDLTAQLLQSPIAYLNGHEAPEFTDVQIKMLKEYIEQGGFILAEACCGRRNFDQGFRKLMQELFPDNPLIKLPPSHPIWRAHAAVPPGTFNLEGIEYGCKTVVVYSPEDLSCSWENNEEKSERAQLAFRLGGNIIAYATGMEPPQPKLTQVEVVKDDPEGKIIPRGYLKVAQLHHGADWRPAPNAMRNLMDHLHKHVGFDVALQSKAIYASDPDLADYKFLYMHGRGAFGLEDAALKNLRNDLENGGLLFADACCGNKAFDAAFRDLAKRLFPNAGLEQIPLNDDLYSAEANGEAITRVKCRTERGSAPGTGDYREVPPYLEGVKIGTRWVVIYSKYDIGCALEKHQSTDCLGHDHASALRLGRAAVMYAFRH
jgi:Domain of unknown function (DUF4159)